MIFYGVDGFSWKMYGASERRRLFDQFKTPCDRPWCYEAKLRRTFFQIKRAGKNRTTPHSSRLGPVESRNRARLTTPSAMLRYPSTAALLRRVDVEGGTTVGRVRSRWDCTRKLRLDRGAIEIAA